jgi:restriction system protein
MKKGNDTWFDDVFEILKHAPAWAGPALAGAVFIFLRYIVLLFVPAAKPGVFDVGVTLRPFLPMFAWLIGGGILMAWVGAEIHKLRIRRLLDTRASVRSLADISWQDFEHLVSEGYRRQGYLAQVVGNPAGDGGVDIELRRNGRLLLVQCKQWKTRCVGVKVVREMLGVVVSRRANRGIIVTSGTFTAEARRFADDNSQTLELLDGPALFDLIRSVQKQPVALDAERPVNRQPEYTAPRQSPPCPTCGAAMVERVARKGSNAGSRFWGCPKYPGCRGTRSNSIS